MNTRRLTISVLVSLVFCAQLVGSDNSRETLAGYQEKIQPFFATYCIPCHGAKTSEGDMRLDSLSPVVSDEQTAETWQEVLDVLNGGEMPPEDEKQPVREELATVIGVLTDGLFEARKRLVDSRHVTLRRLNKREYANTIRDLLGVPVDTAGLPADGTVEGFDTIGDAHFMSTVQFEKYLELGREALDMALVSGPKPERTVERSEPERGSNGKILKTIRDKEKSIEQREVSLRASTLTREERERLQRQLEKDTDALNRAVGYQSQPSSKTGFILDITQEPFGGQAHDKVRAKVPSKPLGRSTEQASADPNPTLGKPVGRYVARFRAGLTCEPKQGRRLFVKVFRSDTVNQQIAYSFPLGTFEITRTVDNPHVFEIPFENFGETDDYIAVKVSDLNIDPNAKPQRGRSKQFPDSTKKAFVWVDWLEVEGPFIEQWPPAAWTQTFFKGLPESEPHGASRGAARGPHNKSPAASASPLTRSAESEYAREIIERFAFRAFRRRKPSDDYIDKVHTIFSDYRSSGSTFVDAIKESLAVVLASPSFVYLVEKPAADEKSHRPLNDLELATRLSYFLWSHPPDEKLFALAEQNRLSEPAVLRDQVERMLNDPKAEVFVEAFTSQWLDLPWLDMIVVNQGRYPEFNEELRQSFREECVQFFGTLIRDNLSATNLIDSDFVMIDDVLARFYGLDRRNEPQGASRRSEDENPAASALPLTSNGFRRVTLPDDSRRGGLLGQGAILTMTSTGERTSPVERGVFVYERLLGRSVPPPPPNVPQLEISSDKPLTIRETLNAHIAKAQCASCHRRMDPLGFAMEHFDAIGKWRDQETVFKASSEVTAKGRPRRSKPLRREIDATGSMPDGKRRFDGHEQLKQYLLQDADGLASGLVRSMLTYALGRRVGFADGEFAAAMQASWDPDTGDTGIDFKLPDAMKPLERHRRSFSVLSNLTNTWSTGTGSHWGSTTFLTGADVRRTPGREFHNDISCDQVAAKHIGQDVRYPSLALTGTDGDIAGCGPGSSLSWDSMGNPIQGISDQVALFSLLFGDGGMTIEQHRNLLNRKRSVLDAVRADAKSVSGVVNSRDKQKVDEYFTLIRSIESRLTRNEDWLSRPKPDAPFEQPAKSPTGTPGVELMFDLMVAALQTDSTRVISYRMPTMSLIREYGETTGATVVGSHPMTHFGTKTSDAYKQLAWRDKKICDLFATLLNKMQAVREPDGTTLLDNSLIVMGSSLRTGHRRRNLPILFAGGGSGIRQGQHVVYKESETPLGNLWLSMLRHVGCPVDSFADSNGVLSEILA